MGVLDIQDLRIRCIVGVHTHERKVEQDLLVDLHLEFDFSEAAHTDQIELTIDYTRLTEMLEAWIQREKFQLIETLATRACILITDEWPQISHCRIKIKKPSALPKALYASVTSEWSVGK
jgi:7,8-dihydroneopterin aldolase/epimerase/oxygenase